jgi:hypothetical protein
MHVLLRRCALALSLVAGVVSIAGCGGGDPATGESQVAPTTTTPAGTVPPAP